MEHQSAIGQFNTAITEAANRAEASALLIRCGYRVYRPEADIHGEDLVVRTPAGVLHGVQLKGRATVDWDKYGQRDLWMLFPSARYSSAEARDWFLISHDQLFEWVKRRHGHAPKWDQRWSYPNISRDLKALLEGFKLSAPSENRDDKFMESGEGLQVLATDDRELVLKNESKRDPC
jgi:hypothetical protein